MVNRHREQVETEITTSLDIVNDPLFHLGIREFQEGRSFDPDRGEWSYERGRLYGAWLKASGLRQDVDLYSMIARLGRAKEEGAVI